MWLVSVSPTGHGGPRVTAGLGDDTDRYASRDDAGLSPSETPARETGEKGEIEKFLVCRAVPG